jgi:mRNA interferase MazF
MIRRGDLVTVVAAGDYGKPRPAVVVQSDVLPETHASVVVCPLTSGVANASDFRIPIDPHAENGLRVRSQVMADKPLTVRRERVGKRIGSLNAIEMTKLDRALALVMGLGG